MADELTDKLAEAVYELFGNINEQKKRQDNCKHLYGRSGGGGQGEPVPEWIKEKENIFKYDYIEILFAYCPKCGKKLIED
jgi:hypothetical protein